MNTQDFVLSSTEEKETDYQGQEVTFEKHEQFFNTFGVLFSERLPQSIGSPCWSLTDLLHPHSFWNLPQEFLINIKMLPGRKKGPRSAGQ